MLHLSTVGENSNVLLILTIMCCSFSRLQLANPQLGPNYQCLKMPERSWQIWAGKDSQEQDQSLGLWCRLTKLWVLATFCSIQSICAVWFLSLLVQGWDLAMEKVPWSWRTDKLCAVTAKGGCGSFLPALCFLLCRYLPKLPSTGFFTSGRGVTSRAI